MSNGDGRDDAEAERLRRLDKVQDADEADLGQHSAGKGGEQVPSGSPKGQRPAEHAPRTAEQAAKRSKTSRAAGRSRQRAKRIEWATFAVSAVAAFGTIAGSWIARGQLSAMQDQLTEMRSDSAQQDRLAALQADLNAAAGFQGAVLDRQAQNTKRLGDIYDTQAVATRDLAATGRNQLATAQDTARRQLRAYPAVLVEALGGLAAGKPLHARVVVENTGQTPVYNEVWLSGFGIYDYPFPTKGISHASCAEIRKMDEGPKQGFFSRRVTIEKDSAFNLTDMQIEGFNVGKTAIVFVGRLCYTDIYEETRHVDFCYFWHAGNGGLNSAAQCDHGNDAN